MTHLYVDLTMQGGSIGAGVLAPSPCDHKVGHEANAPFPKSSVSDDGEGTHTQTFPGMDLAIAQKCGVGGGRASMFMPILPSSIEVNGSSVQDYNFMLV